jgi:intraflagellar transport protein 122
VPRRFKENVELATMMVKAKPYHDNEDLLTLCYRCSTTNPLINNRSLVNINLC